MYHKEEYQHTKKFYDDGDNSKYYDSYDDHDSYYKGNHGKAYKGGEYKVGDEARLCSTFYSLRPLLHIQSKVKNNLYGQLRREENRKLTVLEKLT